MAKLILLTGAPGSGKTTTAKHFLEPRKDAWAYINQDDIRQLVKSGYESADDLYENWNENTKKQWSVSIPICVDLAKRYQEYDINCLIDFYSTAENFKEWKKYLAGINYSLIILMPNKEVVMDRNSRRKYPSKLSNAKILQAIEEFQSWRSYKDADIIDNSQGSPVNTIKLIQNDIFINGLQ